MFTHTAANNVLFMSLLLSKKEKRRGKGLKIREASVCREGVHGAKADTKISNVQIF